MPEEKSAGNPTRKRKKSQYNLALEKVQQAQEAQSTEQEHSDIQTDKHLDSQSAEQLDSQPSEHQTVETPEQSDIQTVEQENSQTAEHPKTKASEQLESKTSKRSNSRTAKHSDVKTVNQLDSQMVSQPNIQTEKQSDSEPSKRQRIKATFYLEMDDIIAVDTLQTQRFRQTGKKPEKSELVSEAIQLLFRQPNS